MNQSETVTEITAALTAAQGQLRNAPADTVNNFKHYRYASLASILDTVRKPLADNGLCHSQPTQWHDNALWLVTWIRHTSGEWLSSEYPVYGVFEDPRARPTHQDVGAAVTYARRYALMALLGIAPECGEDLDAQPPEQNGRERHQRTDDRPPQNDGPPRGTPGAARKSIGELIDLHVDRITRKFRDTFPGATTELPNPHLVARHLYRVAGEADPPWLEQVPGLKSGDVFRALNKLGRDRTAHDWLVAELKRYLAAKTAEAKERAQDEAEEARAAANGQGREDDETGARG